MLPSGDISSNKNFIQIPTLRSLSSVNNNFTTNNTRINMYSANGVNALITGFVMIFISVKSPINLMFNK